MDDSVDSPLHLTTSQVAELLCVHASTVKRWCNEGDLDVGKTGGGHRRIHLGTVLELAGQRGLDTFLAPFAPDEGAAWRAITAAVEDGSFESVGALALEWLGAGDAPRLAALFQTLGRHPGVPFPRFCDEGVRGFMRRVGELWRCGRLRVGDEHLASQTLVEALLGLRGPGPDGGPGGALGPGHAGVAVVGSTEGNRHELGAQCVRLLLERRGWRVFYLGGDLPIEECAAAQRVRRAGLVGLSFAPPHTAADMQRCLRLLGEFTDPGRPYALALGGDLGEPPELDDLARPFREVGVFGSLGAFGSALERGFGSA